MPSVNLVRTPLSVSCSHLSRGMLGTPMLCKYFVTNISEDVQSVYVTMGAEMGDQPAFLIAGETVTKVDLMPYSEQY